MHCVRFKRGFKLFNAVLVISRVMARHCLQSATCIVELNYSVVVIDSIRWVVGSWFTQPSIVKTQTTCARLRQAGACVLKLLGPRDMKSYISKIKSMNWMCF